MAFGTLHPQIWVVGLSEYYLGCIPTPPKYVHVQQLPSTSEQGQTPIIPHTFWGSRPNGKFFTQCSSFLVLTCFLLRDYDICTKKELRWSPRVHTFWGPGTSEARCKRPDLEPAPEAQRRWMKETDPKGPKYPNKWYLRFSKL